MAVTPSILTRSLARSRAVLSRSSLPVAASRSYNSSSNASIIIQHRPTAPPQTPQASFRIHRPALALALALATRPFSSSPARRHGHVDPPKEGEELWVTFIEKDGQEHKIAVSAGDNLLDIAQAHDLDMEGACGGSCACSTCHVVVQSEEYYDKIPEPDDDENDMLDLAFGLTETSRLGCQVVMTPELDGLVVKLPSMTRNLQASDFKS